MALGAGRLRVEDSIDHGAGILLHRKPGDPVASGDTILELLYNDDRGLEAATALAREAIAIASEPPQVRPLVVGAVR
jgi:thymidine phosphorylase